MKILIDRSIERYAVTHDTRMVPHTVKWGPHISTVSVAQRTRKQPGPSDVFIIEQLPYLVSLCNVARQGNLEFCTSFELEREALRQRSCAQGLLGIDFFLGIRMTRVPCPAQRESFSGIIDPLAYFGKEEQLKFLRGIQHPRFLLLRKLLGDAQLADAFHLWTAEEASLDVFLTMDKKFRNNVYNQRNEVKSSVSVIAPKEVCEQLGLASSSIEKLAAEINPFS
jgi:hypothetical protein